MEKVFVEQYESFVGKRFYHKDDKNLVYTFGSIIEDKCQIIDKTLDSVGYGVEETLGLIRNGYWILEN